MAGRTALLVAHRVLIAMAIALSAVLLAHGIARFVAHNDVPSLVTGVLAVPVGIALAVYLRWFARKK